MSFRSWLPRTPHDSVNQPEQCRGMQQSFRPLALGSITRSVPSTALTAATPSDSLIEGLKQGNTVEMELVKKLKEGLDFIVDGMQRECLNRSDALSELREELREENAQTQGVGEKTELARLVAESIKNCKYAKQNSKKRLLDKLRKAHDAFNFKAKLYDKCVTREKEQLVYLRSAVLWLQRITATKKFPLLFERLNKNLYEFKDSWVDSKEARAARGQTILARLEERVKNARELYHAEQEAWQKEETNLRQMARVAGLDLRAV